MRATQAGTHRNSQYSKCNHSRDTPPNKNYTSSNNINYNNNYSETDDYDNHRTKYRSFDDYSVSAPRK